MTSTPPAPVEPATALPQKSARALQRRILELDEELQTESRRLAIARLERDELYAAVLAEQEHRARLQRVVSRLARELKQTQKAHALEEQQRLAAGGAAAGGDEPLPLRLWDLEAPDYERLKYDYGRLRQTSLHQIVADLEGELATCPSPAYARSSGRGTETPVRSPEMGLVAGEASEGAPAAPPTGPPSVIGVMVDRHVREAASRIADAACGLDGGKNSPAGWATNSPAGGAASSPAGGAKNSPAGAGGTGRSAASRLAEIRRRAFGDAETPSAVHTPEAGTSPWLHRVGRTGGPVSEEPSASKAGGSDDDGGWERAAVAMRQRDLAEAAAEAAAAELVAVRRDLGLQRAELEAQRGEAARLCEARVEALQSDAKLRNQLETVKAAAVAAEAAVKTELEAVKTELEAVKTELEAVKTELRAALAREAELRSRSGLTPSATQGGGRGGGGGVGGMHGVPNSIVELEAMAAREAAAVGAAQRAEEMAAEAAAQVVALRAELAGARASETEAPASPDPVSGFSTCTELATATRQREAGLDAPVVQREEQLRGLRRELAAADERAHWAETRLAQAERRAHEAEGLLAQEEGKVDEMEGQLARAEGRAQLAEGRLVQAEGRLAALKKEMADVHARGVSASPSLAHADQRASELEACVQALEGRLQAAEAGARRAAAENEAERGRRAAAEAAGRAAARRREGEMAAELETTREAVRAARAEAHTRTLALEGELATARAEARSAAAAASLAHERELEEVRSQLRTEWTRLTEARARGGTRAVDMAPDLAAELAGARRELAVAQGRADELAGRLDASLQRAREMQSQLDRS
eukprot:scaffold270_cov121-Isochrysis_galbana.AAC.34